MNIIVTIFFFGEEGGDDKNIPVLERERERALALLGFARILKVQNKKIEEINMRMDRFNQEIISSN